MSIYALKNVIKPILATRAAFHRFVDQRYSGSVLSFDVAGTRYVVGQSSLVKATVPLGLLSAATSIALAMRADPSALLIGTSAFLSATSLTCLAAIIRSKMPLASYAANLAAWVACGGIIAAQNPIVGISAWALSVASLVGVALSSKVTASTIVSQTDDTIAETVPALSDILVSKKGEVLADCEVAGMHLCSGVKFIDYLHVHDRVSFMRAVSQLLAGGSEREDLDAMVNVSPGGSAAQFKNVKLSIAIFDGHLSVSMTDVEEIFTENEVVETATPNTNANNFLAVVSHELRTPLNAIIGFSDVLRHDKTHELPDATRDEYATLIHGAGSHLLALVNTILDVSKIEAGSYSIHREDFDFHSTVHDCVALLGGAASQKNIQINERFTSELGSVNADRRAVKQIMLNLLSNAVKYTGKNGFITVDAVQNETEITIEVSDTGIGMGEADLAEIGKPFAQVDNSTTRSNEGTGLGLALVKGLTSLHGGRVDIRSKLNVGTRVIITIPTVQPNAEGCDNADTTVINLTELMTSKNSKSVKTENKEITKNERKIG